MFIDYEQGQIILYNKPWEKFTEIQEKTNFDLCLRLRNQRYEVPFVALPLIIECCKKCGYSLNYSPKLIKKYEMNRQYRLMMEKLRDGIYVENDEIIKIKNFLESVSKQYNITYTETQIQTIIYGILGKRVAIANEIGTGKTLVINTIIKYLVENQIIRKAIVFCPSPLVLNFVNDYYKFFGKNGIIAIKNETKKERFEMYKYFQSISNIHTLVTNFEKCLFDIEYLKEIKIDLICVDEFHRMRNYQSAKRSKNFFEMLQKQWDCEYRFPMSGTPIENQLFDLYPVFKFLNNGFALGGEAFFDRNFVKKEQFMYKIKTKNKRTILRIEQRPIGFKNIAYLKKLIKPLIIRKKLQMPVGCYNDFVFIEPSKKLIETYEKIKHDNEGTVKRYHEVRQFLNDTRRGNLEDNPKWEELKNILIQTTEKIVIFTFYHCGVKAISDCLKSIGVEHLIITGESKEEPISIIKKFENSNAQCLICTDCISFGVNIPFARILINWELPLKPSTTEQRIGRIYRTGQQKDVHVYSLVVKNTVEEKIYLAHEMKKELIKKVIEELNEVEKIEKDIEEIVYSEFEK